MCRWAISDHHGRANETRATNPLSVPQLSMLQKYAAKKQSGGCSPAMRWNATEARRAEQGHGVVGYVARQVRWTEMSFARGIQTQERPEIQKSCHAHSAKTTNRIRPFRLRCTTVVCCRQSSFDVCQRLGNELE